MVKKFVESEHKRDERGRFAEMETSLLKKRQMIELDDDERVSIHDEEAKLKGSASFDVYNYSSDIDKYQPDISYKKNVNTESKKNAIFMYTSGEGLTDYVSINTYLNGTATFTENEKAKLDFAIRQN